MNCSLYCRQPTFTGCGYWVILVTCFAVGGAAQDTPESPSWESSEQLVRLLWSNDFHERERATASLTRQQLAAVEPVFEAFLQSSDQLEIRKRCHRILLRLIEAEPFLTEDPTERYGLSRRLLALDTEKFPALKLELTELRQLSVKPFSQTGIGNLATQLKTNGLRFEQRGKQSVVWIENSWNKSPEKLRPIQALSFPTTVILGHSYRYEYLKQILGNNVGEITYQSNQHSKKPGTPRTSLQSIGERDTRLMARFSELRSLDLAYAPLLPKAARHLGPLKKLERLAIGGGTIKDEDLDFLSQLKNLAHLDIRHTTRVDGLFLKNLKPLKNLVALNLETARIQDENLSGLTQLQSLKTLYAPRTIGDKGLHSIAQIASLEVLVLPQSTVTQEGIESLAKLKNLYHLSINMKRLDDEAMVAIAQLAGLRSIQLTETRLTGEGFSYLNRLKKLESLSIESKSITASGLLKLSEIENLRRVQLLKHELTSKDIERLQELKPHLKISY